jgi:acyl-CoA thioester hydrolase
MSHYYQVQIFYEDTDGAGIVYHANYAKYMERARTLFLEEKGFTLPDLKESYGVQFVIRTLQIQYEKPATLQQKLIVVTELTKFGKVSLTFQQTLFLDPSDKKTMICSGEVVIVCTNLNFKPCAIPMAVMRELKSEH